MVLKITFGLWLFFSINAMASTDSLLSVSQQPRIEILGPLQEREPSKSTISGTIHLNGKTIPDSFFVGIGELKLLPILMVIRPKNSQTIDTTAFTFNVEPGLYTLVVSAFGYETLTTSVLVPDTNTKVAVKASLEPLGLKPGDQWVKLWGDFCRWRPWGAIEMVQRDSVWVLPGENPVKKGEGYRFILSNNGSGFYDLRHSHARLKSRGIVTFNSIYHGGEIVFDPSLYTQPKRDSRAEFSGVEHQAAFSRLVEEIKAFRKENWRAQSKGQDTTRSSENNASGFIEREERFREIANRYPAYFEQFILRMKFDFLERSHPHKKQWLDMKSLKSEQQEYDNKRKEHYQSVVYESYFSQMAQLLKKVDPNSVFFEGYDAFVLTGLDEGLYHAPHLGEKYNVPPFFFTGILMAHERNLPPGTQEGVSLLWGMAQRFQAYGYIVAARNTIDYLIQRYPNSRTVLEGGVERMLNALKLQEESVAPEFVMQAVGGDSLRLSDFRGKFVFLDFWATWCGPCINELPNLKKLHQSFPERDLTIIGLAYNDPRDLEDFIRIHEIPYPNGVSNKTILKAYGIVAWPTTYLIAPDGKIIAKNLRGEKLADLVKEKITMHNSP